MERNIVFKPGKKNPQSQTCLFTTLSSSSPERNPSLIQLFSSSTINQINEYRWTESLLIW